MPAPSPDAVAEIARIRAEEEARGPRGLLDFGPIRQTLPRPSIPFGQQRGNLLGYLQNENIPLSAITPLIGGYLSDVDAYSSALSAEQARRQQVKSDYLMTISQGLIEGAVSGTPDAVAYDLLNAQMNIAGVNDNSPLMAKAYETFREVYPTYGNASYTATQGAPAPSGGNFSPLYTGEQLVVDAQGQQAISSQVSSLIQTLGAEGKATTEITSSIENAIMTQAGFQPILDPTTGQPTGGWGQAVGEPDPITGMPAVVPVPAAAQMQTSIGNALNYWLPAYEAQQAQIMAQQQTVQRQQLGTQFGGMTPEQLAAQSIPDTMSGMYFPG